MREHPKIEIYFEPVIRVRTGNGVLLGHKYKLYRHAIERYLRWKYFGHASEEELNDERARMTDMIEDALSDMPRVDKVVIS